MHLSLMEHLKSQNNLSRPQCGIVVANDDPLKRMRVKVTIIGVFEETNLDKLPWVYPRLEGDILGTKFLKVPLLGSKLEIRFDTTNRFGDVNFPFWVGYWIDKTNSLADEDLEGYNELFKANYGSVNGYEDEDHNYSIVNSVEHFFEQGFYSGYKRRIDSEGNLTDKFLKSFLMEAEDSIKLNSILVQLGTENFSKLIREGHLGKYNTLVNAVDSWINSVTDTLGGLDPVIDISGATGDWTDNIGDSLDTDDTNLTSETEAN